MKKNKENKEIKAAEAAEKVSGGELFDWIQCIVVALVASILVFLFLGRTVGVIGGSMQPTLFEGDRLIISDLFYTPENGDIVVLRQPSFRNEPIVKRVIATEGQTVDIDFENAIVYVDGKAIEEPYLREFAYFESQDFDRQITVPEGCIFVLGDNRNASTDSRTDSIGCVDVRNVLGKVLWRISPLNSFGSVY